MQNKVIEDIEVFCIQPPSHTDVLIETKYCDQFYVSSYLIYFLVSLYCIQLFQFISKQFKSMNIKLYKTLENLPSAFLHSFLRDMEKFCNFDLKKKCALQGSTCCFYKTLLRNGSTKNGG